MDDSRIEILGQKLAYPSTVYGAFAVGFVSLALVLIAWIVASWATPEALSATRTLLAQEAEKNSEIVAVNKELLSQLEELESKLISKVSTGASETTDAEINAELERLRTRREQAYQKLLEDQKQRAKASSDILADQISRPEVRAYTGQQQQQTLLLETQLKQIQQQQHQQQQQQQR